MPVGFGLGSTSWRPTTMPLVAVSCALELALMLWIGVGVTQRLAGFLQLCPEAMLMQPSSVLYNQQPGGLGAEIEACGSPILQPYVPALRLPSERSWHARTANDQAVRDIVKLLASRTATTHEAFATGSNEEATLPRCGPHAPWSCSARQALAQACHYANPKTLWDLGEATMAVREIHLILHILLAVCFPGVYALSSVRAALFISDRLTTWGANIPALLFARGPHIVLGTTLLYSLARRRTGVLFVGLRALTTRVPFRLQILVAPVEWLIVLTIMTLVDQRLYGHVLVDAQQVLTSFLAVAVVPTVIVWMYDRHKLRQGQEHHHHHHQQGGPQRLPSPLTGAQPGASSGQPHRKASLESFDSASSCQPSPAVLATKPSMDDQTVAAGSSGSRQASPFPPAPSSATGDSRGPDGQADQQPLPEAHPDLSGSPSSTSVADGSTPGKQPTSPSASASVTPSHDQHELAAVSSHMEGRQEAPDNDRLGAEPSSQDVTAPHTPFSDTELSSGTGPATSPQSSNIRAASLVEAPAAGQSAASGSRLMPASVLLSSVRPSAQPRAEPGAQALVPHARPSLSWRGRTRAVPVSIKVTQHPGDYTSYAARLRTAALQGALSHNITQAACPSAPLGTARVIAATCVQGCVQLLAFVHGLRAPQEPIPDAWAAGGVEDVIQAAEHDVEDLLLEALPGPVQVVGGVRIGEVQEGRRHAALRILCVDPVVVASSSEGCTFTLGVSAPLAEGPGSDGSYPARIVVATSSGTATATSGLAAPGGGHMGVGGLLSELSVHLQPGSSEVSVPVPALPGPAQGARDLSSLIIWLLPGSGGDAAGHAQPLPSLLSTAVVPVLPPGPAVEEMRRLWETMQQEFDSQQQVEQSQQQVEQEEQQALTQQVVGGVEQGPADEGILLTSLSSNDFTTASAITATSLSNLDHLHTLYAEHTEEARAAVFRDHWQGMVQDMVWVTAQLKALHQGQPASTTGSDGWDELDQVRGPLCEYLRDQGLHHTASLIHCPETEHIPPPAASEEEHTGEGNNGSGRGVGPPPAEGFHGGANLQYFAVGQLYLHDGTASDATPSAVTEAPGLEAMLQPWANYDLFKSSEHVTCATVPLLVRPSKMLGKRLALHHTAPQATCLMARAVSVATTEAVINAAVTHSLAGAWQGGVPGSWGDI